MKNTAWPSVLVLLCSFAASFYGQDSLAAKETASPDASQPGISAAEVIDKYMAATGGIEARRALQSIEASGRFGVNGFHDRLMGGLGDFHFYYKSPANDAFELQHAQGGFQGSSWFGHRDGKVFLRRTTESNWALNGVTIEALDNAWLAVGEWDFKRIYSEIKLVGRLDVNGSPAYALMFTPRDGDPQVRYFDTRTFLLVRMDQVSSLRPREDDPARKIRVETYYSDYKDTNGIKFPRILHAIGASKSPKQQMEFVAGDLKVNHDIKDGVFKAD